MFQGIKNILFATNLTQNCLPAFDFAAVLALRFQAKIVLLHVLEKLPNYAESRLEGILGEAQWKETVKAYEDEVRQSLIGKRSSSKLIRKALEQICTDAGIDEASCGYQSREVVIGDGDIVESIITTSKKYDCDLIILGPHEGLLATHALGGTLKSVMQRSTVPVLMVPVPPGFKPDFKPATGWRE